MKKLIIKYLTTNHKKAGKEQWNEIEVNMSDDVFEITSVELVEQTIARKRVQRVL